MVTPVVVEAESVERSRDLCEIPVADVREVAHRAQVLQHVVGVAALQDGVVPEPVGDAVDTSGRVAVLGTRTGRHDGVRVQGDGHLGIGHGGPQGIHGQSVAEQQVVGGGHRCGRLRAPGRVHAGGVAQHRRAPRLVHRAPPADAVAEGLGHDRRVVAEAQRRLPGRPAPRVLQRLRQVPVVQRGHRLDVVGQQLVDEGPVEVEAGGADAVRPGRLHPGPGDREPVGVDAERAEQADVLAVAASVVGGDGGVVTPSHLAGRGRERVPDRRAAAVAVHAALDLVRGRPGAEEEARREGGRRQPFTAPAVRPRTK
jgi:hypothetical protein